MALLAPAIRADPQLAVEYRWDASREPISVPVVAFGGQTDRVVEPDSVMQRHQITRSRFSMHLLPGDHSYLDEQQETVLRLIGHSLEARGV